MMPVVNVACNRAASANARGRRGVQVEALNWTASPVLW